MTIRRRLTLTFLTILILFGLNLAMYFWSSQKRSASVEELQRAMSRRILVTSLIQDLNTLRKQVELVSEVTVGAEALGAPSEEIAKFNGQLEAARKQIGELQELASPAPASRIKVESLAKTYQDLSASWRTVYQNFGVNQPKAVTELATRAEPLGQRITDEILPQLEQDEKARVEEAKTNFDRSARLMNRITMILFAFSTVLAIVAAYQLSSYLTRSLAELQLGSMYIGSGILNYRIAVKGEDELGNLARSYNDMAENLHEARKELTKANTELEKRNEEVEKQKEVAESLLLNILPFQVADELRVKGRVEPKYFEDATVMFTDFVGFTLSTETVAAEDLVHVLHDYFTAFDQIVERYYLEKLKTIGDSYMCVGGLPLGRRARRSPSHPVDAVLAAFEMVRAVLERDRPDALVHWAVRVGIHTGPVIAGVVGIHKFLFDIWGDSVNYASRMESGAAPNRINLSERTYSRVKDFVECEYRGKVLTKDKKELDMYFAKGILPRLIDDPTQAPPPAFVRRYNVYFQKDPPAFPAFLLETVQAPSP